MEGRMTYEEAVKQIEPKRGLLSQVWKLGEHYEHWVDKYSLEKTYRLFDSNLLEPLSKTVWYAIPLIWIPIITLLSFLATHCGAGGSEDMLVCQHVMPAPSLVTLKQLPILLVLGVLVWTAIEYFLHRFLFHLPASSPFGITLHFALHGQHHKYPNDPTRLVFPPAAAAVLAFLFYSLYTSVLPLHMARALMAGSLVGYVGYDMIHYYLHHGAPRTKYFGSLKRSHMHHHYKEHSVDFGISSKLWDLLLFTHH